MVDEIILDSHSGSEIEKNFTTQDKEFRSCWFLDYL